MTAFLESSGRVSDGADSNFAADTDAAVDFLRIMTASASEGGGGGGMSLQHVATALAVPQLVLTSALASRRSSRLLRRQLRKWIQGITASTSSATGIGAWDFSRWPRALAARVVAESNASDALDASAASSDSHHSQHHHHHHHHGGEDEEDVTTSIFSMLDDDVRQHFELLAQKSGGQNFSSILNSPPADPQVEAAARAAEKAASSWSAWMFGTGSAGAGGAAGSVGGGGSVSSNNARPHGNHHHHHQHHQSHSAPSSNHSNEGSNAHASGGAVGGVSGIAGVVAVAGSPATVAASQSLALSHSMLRVPAACSSSQAALQHISAKATDIAARVSTMAASDLSVIDAFTQKMQTAWNRRQKVLSEAEHSNQMLGVLDQVESLLAEGKPLIPPTLPSAFTEPGFPAIGAIVRSAFPGPVLVTYDEKEKKVRTTATSAAHMRAVEEEDCNAATDTVAALEGLQATVNAWLMCYVHRQSRGFYEASKTFDVLAREGREALSVGDSAFHDVSNAGGTLTDSFVVLARLQRRKQNLGATLELLTSLERHQRRLCSALKSRDPVVAASRITKAQEALTRHRELAHLDCLSVAMRSLQSKRTMLLQMIPNRAATYWGALGHWSSSSSSSSSLSDDYWQQSEALLRAAIDMGCVSGCLVAYRDRVSCDFAASVLRLIIKSELPAWTPPVQQSATTALQHYLTSPSNAARLTSKAFTGAVAQLMSHVPHGPAFLRVAALVLTEVMSLLRGAVQHCETLFDIVSAVVSEFQFQQRQPGQVSQATPAGNDEKTNGVTKKKKKKKAKNDQKAAQSVSATMAVKLLSSGSAKEEHMSSLRDVAILCAVALAESKPLDSDATAGDFTTVRALHTLLQIAAKNIAACCPSSTTTPNSNNNSNSSNSVFTQLNTLGVLLARNCFKLYHNKLYEKMITIMQQDDWVAVEKVDPAFQDAASRMCACSAEDAADVIRKDQMRARGENGSFADVVQIVMEEQDVKQQKPALPASSSSPSASASAAAAVTAAPQNVLFLSSAALSAAAAAAAGHGFSVTNSLLLLVEIFGEYDRFVCAFPQLSHEVVARVANLTKMFDTQCTALVLGGGAVDVGTVAHISWTHLGIASVDLKLLVQLVAAWEARVRAIVDAAGLSPQKLEGPFGEMARYRSDLAQHRIHLLQKIVSTFEEKVAATAAPPSATLVLGDDGPQALQSWLLAHLKDVARLRKAVKAAFAAAGGGSATSSSSASSTQGKAVVDEVSEDTILLISALHVVAGVVKKMFRALAATESNAKRRAVETVVPLFRVNVQQSFGFSAVAVVQSGHLIWACVEEGGAQATAAAFAAKFGQSAPDDPTLLQELMSP